MFANKYHLPHNSIRIDEFNHMLGSIDLNKEYYYYEELRLLFLKKQIVDGKLAVFHPRYDINLSNHENRNIVRIYELCKQNPSDDNLNDLLNCQYTPAKTFKQVFNETVRDYTEFFAFLGLLPTYYKGRAGGEKKHYVSQRLKDYLNNIINLSELLLDFKYRNTSKDFESIDMYAIEVRPFVVALRALNYFFKHGFTKVNNKIISAIVVYSKDENENSIEEMCRSFSNPALDVSNYRNLFSCNSFNSVDDELTRASLFLRPYLYYLGVVDFSDNKKFYVPTAKKIDDIIYPKKAVYCNMRFNDIKITPVIGKILYKLYVASKKRVRTVNYDELFDSNITREEADVVIENLLQIGCISSYVNDIINVGSLENQCAINPYTEFFDYEECNYVANVADLDLSNEAIVLSNHNNELENLLESLKAIALGSNGAKYEESIYNVMNTYIKPFDVKWYGSAASGRRLSDIFIKTKIRDRNETKNIGIIVECKAGQAVKGFDERKEIEDALNTIRRENSDLSGIWYWVVNGDSLPNVDLHGGYRSNAESLSFIEKLNYIQFELSEYSRVPTIVTAFSYDAIKNYILYLYDKLGQLERNNSINKIDIPHFWRWSKKFMNIQYVMVHKELRLN